MAERAAATRLSREFARASVGVRESSRCTLSDSVGTLRQVNGVQVAQDQLHFVSYTVTAASSFAMVPPFSCTAAGGRSRGHHTTKMGGRKMPP